MKEYSPKHSKKLDARQATREARKAANRCITPDRIERIITTPDGRELIVHKHHYIPGYTYSF